MTAIPTTVPSADPATDRTTGTLPVVVAQRDRSARAVRSEAITAELITRLTTDPDPEGESVLREELVRLHMPLAASVASRYASRGIATEDLRQVAYLALTKAALRFDPTLGHPFVAFCLPTIRGEVRRHFRDHGWMVRPPRRIQELQQRLSGAETLLTHDLGRTPTPAELAAAVEAPIDDVLEALDSRGCFTPASLDRPVGEDGGGAPLGELLDSEDADFSDAEARIALGPVVKCLSARDRHILKLRFYDGLTQREIATDIGVTQMQVSRLLTRIFRDLRNGLGSLDQDAPTFPLSA